MILDQSELIFHFFIHLQSIHGKRGWVYNLLILLIQFHSQWIILFMDWCVTLLKFHINMFDWIVQLFGTNLREQILILINLATKRGIYLLWWQFALRIELIISHHMHVLDTLTLSDLLIEILLWSLLAWLGWWEIFLERRFQLGIALIN